MKTLHTVTFALSLYGEGGSVQDAWRQALTGMQNELGKMQQEDPAEAEGVEIVEVQTQLVPDEGDYIIIEMSGGVVQSVRVVGIVTDDAETWIVDWDDLQKLRCPYCGDGIRMLSPHESVPYMFSCGNCGQCFTEEEGMAQLRDSIVQHP